MSDSPHTVLVTGASGGIGGAVARAFLEAGARVALHHHTGAGRVHGLMAESGCGTDRARAFAADLTTVHGPAELIDAVRAWAGGPLHGLIHAAGDIRDGSVALLSEADWDHVLALHLSAPVRMLTKNPMADGGFVLFLGSGAGTHGRAGQAAYGAAKSGLCALTEALAAAWGTRGIRVNTVLPGPVDTGLWQGLSAGQRLDVSARHRLERLNTPGDVAAFLLAVSRMPGTSGQVIPMDSAGAVPGW